MANKRMMMIGGFTGLYEKASACGIDVTVAQDRDDVAGADIMLVDQLITAEKNDPMLIELAAVLHQKQPFDFVVSFYEDGVMNAALIGERLGIDANPLAPVLLTKDKGKMRAHMIEAGIPSIPFVVAATPGQVLDFAQATGWPIILKPASGMGSKQIHKLHHEYEIAVAFEAIRLAYPGIDPIAEKFIQGTEVSVEGMSWDGQHVIIGVTDKITTGAPHFVETGHNLPSALPPALQEQIKALTLRFLASVKHQFGPSHTEVIISPDGPIIVESHTRVGGDRIFEMVEHVYGVDLFSLTFKGFSGAYPGVLPKPPSAAAVRFITLPQGRVSSIGGLDAARQMPGVVRVELHLQIGQQVKAVTQNSDRHGLVLALGATLDEAVVNVNAALATLKIDVAPA